MNGTAIALQPVTVGQAKMPYARPHRGDTFLVFADGHQVGEMWRYGRAEETRWRAHREGFGASLSNHLTQESAAAAVGWAVQIEAMQLPYRVRLRTEPVRVISRSGDVLTFILAEADPERQLVSCTAIVSGDAVQDALNQGGCDAVRRRVAEQFGVRVVGGGQRGSHGDPVILFTAHANHKMILHP